MKERSYGGHVIRKGGDENVLATTWLSFWLPRGQERGNEKFFWPSRYQEWRFSGCLVKEVV
jgi:hypothetical protein